MMVSVFVGTSVDGFIARPNVILDFLPPAAARLPTSLLATVDAIVMVARR